MKARNLWKYCLVLLLALPLPLLPAAAAAAGGTEVVLQTEAAILELGKTFTVRVFAKETANLYASEVRLAYDGDRLAYVSSESGFKNSFPIVKEEANRLLLANTLTDKSSGITGDALLYSVTFRTLREGRTTIELMEGKEIAVVDDRLIQRTVTLGDGLAIEVAGPSGGTPSNPSPSNPAPSQPQDQPSLIASNTLKDEDGSPVRVVEVDAEQLAAEIAALREDATRSSVLALNIPDTQAAVRVLLPAQALADAADVRPDALLRIESELAVYDLPLALLASLLPEELAGVEGVSIIVHIEAVAGEAGEAAQDVLDQHGVESLFPPLEFQIWIDAPSGRTAINDFGNRYVERHIALPEQTDPARTSAVRIDPASGKLYFVPAVFTMQDGKPFVTMKRTGNSIYAVITNAKTFSDMESHWAKREVETLASKLLVNGVSSDRFAPDVEVTRAQFAAMLVRALGLQASGESAAGFSDVTANDWFTAEVAAAKAYGLVQGVGGDRFAPNEQITREQMAVLLARALQFTGATPQETDVPRFAEFRDVDAVSPWAAEAMELAIRTGMMNGRSDSQLAPSETATRAEASVMLFRMLKAAAFMN